MAQQINLMKQLLIIRHAKSSWDTSILKDFDRPLNERGLKDAPAMAKRLLERKIFINSFISSTAKRAFTTATFFYERYKKAGYKTTGVIGIEELYLAPPKVFESIICNVNDALNTVAIFAHNPGITEFANELTNTRIDEMPTCSVFAVKIETDSWKDFADAKKSFWFFDCPKRG